MAPSDSGTIISSFNCPIVIYLRLTNFLTVLSPSYCVIDSVLGGVHINRKRQRSPIVYTKDVCWAAMIKDRMFGNYTEVRQKSFFLLPSIQTDSDIAKKSRKFIPLSSSLSRYRKATQWPDCSKMGKLFFNPKRCGLLGGYFSSKDLSIS